jgi:hypothetical protein
VKFMRLKPATDEQAAKLDMYEQTPREPEPEPAVESATA